MYMFDYIDFDKLILGACVTHCGRAAASADHCG